MCQTFPSFNLFMFTEEDGLLPVIMKTEKKIKQLKQLKQLKQMEYYVNLMLSLDLHAKHLSLFCCISEAFRNFDFI